MSEWGPGIKHDGKGWTCKGQLCQAEFVDGQVVEGVAGSGGECSWFWTAPTWSGSAISPSGHRAMPIIRYRIRKPRGLAILESILSEINAPVKEVV